MVAGSRLGLMRVAVAIVAAYALALQTLAFGFANAAPAVAGFAAICAPAGAAGDDSRHPQDRPDANACCLLACPSKGPAAGGPTEAAARPAPPLRAATKAAFPEADAEALPPPVLRPFDARGPPVLA